MFGTLKGRLLVIVGVAALAAFSLWQNGIKLGLDLQGGMHLALEVQDPNGTLTDEQRADYTDQNLEILRNRIGQFGVEEPLIQKVGTERIIVELPGIRDEERAKNIIRQQAFLEWKLVRPSREVLNVISRMDRAVAAALGPEELGADGDEAPADTSASAATQRDVRDLLFGRADTASDTLGADTTEAASTPAERPLSSLLLQGTGDGEFAVLETEVERVKRYLAQPGVIAALPRGTELRWGADPYAVGGSELYRPLYFMESRPFITGERLQEAVAGRDPQYNKTIVTFQLDRRGGREFERVTSQHIGDRIAIVLDTLVHSAPVVNGRIGASGQIELGQAPLSEAQDLALVLRAGAFAAPLEIVEQRSVGPSLGRDSIDQGKLAGILGVVFVIAIMIAYYRVTGILAIVALGFYVLLVLGGLSALPNATLTAPGIAGLILSVGMAVDANVLIFERIREELALGRTTRVAVDAGFQHAMSAIVDSNLTTLITALILFQVGTGPVRGFAVTLSIGIVASFFTAVFITRTFFMVYLDRKRANEAISI
jgi:preprotein translocase subunit SecD